MKKLLFAPADPRISTALRSSLLTRQAEWQSEVLSLSDAPPEILAKSSWDAVVTDIETEKGRDLLARSRHDFPEIARIGVVNQAKRTAAHLAVAQQIVPSFTDFGEMEIAVERCCSLRDLLRGERICRTLGELGELPSAPTVYLELMDALNGGDASVAEVAEIIEGDTGISAKLLQVVNSAVFRTSREIVTVKMAAGFLGLDVVKNVVLSVEAFQAFEKLPSIPDFSFSGLQSHCRSTAAIAGRMGLSNDVRDAAVVAALLHDIGKLVLAYKVPDRFARILARARTEGEPLYRMEEELWGITHAEVGAYLLGLWGLPTQVTEAIAYHHAPASVPARALDAIGSVYVANCLAHEIEDGRETMNWNKNYLNAWKGADRLTEWRTVARQIALSQHMTASKSDVPVNAEQRVPAI